MNAVDTEATRAAFCHHVIDSAIVEHSFNITLFSVVKELRVRFN